MTLETIRIILDFGLVVLIWMVQLLIYPSFVFYQTENLGKWHEKYTKRIAVIVIPLMMGQLLITSYQVYQHQGFYEVASMLLVGLLWISTFLQFVPLHNNIASTHDIQQSVKKLVQRNWIRTFLWTLLFSVSLWNFFKA